MEHFVAHAALAVGTVIEAIAIAVIAVGVLQGIASLAMVMFRVSAAPTLSFVWLGFARWLVAGLTFQLAADIVHTTVTPTWEEIGRVAAIAVIRTFLTVTLEREMSEVRTRQSEMPERVVAESSGS